MRSFFVGFHLRQHPFAVTSKAIEPWTMVASTMPFIVCPMNGVFLLFVRRRAGATFHSRFGSTSMRSPRAPSAMRGAPSPTMRAGAA